jgi:hypothetical protein
MSKDRIYTLTRYSHIISTFKNAKRCAKDFDGQVRVILVLSQGMTFIPAQIPHITQLQASVLPP